MKTRLSSILLSTAALTCLPAIAHAQTQAADAAPAADAASDTTGLNEIVVTAEHRSLSVQKSPLNISVVGAEELAKSGTGSSRELLDAIPGLKLTVGNNNNYVGLYGLGSGGGTQWTDAVMTFNYGGVPLARQVALSSAYYDLERVEVVKGPQGTLYGRNATVGAINVVLARPKHDYEGGMTVAVGNYHAINANGFINAPVTDKIAARVAFQTTNHDGYYSNGYDDAKNYGVRGSLLLEPTDRLSILLMADGFFNRQKGNFSTWRYYLSPTQEWINPKDPWDTIGAPGAGCTSQLLCPTFASTTVGGVNAQTPVSGFASTNPNAYQNVPVAGNDGYVRVNQLLYSGELGYEFDFAKLTAQFAHVDTHIDFKNYTNGLVQTNLTDSYQNSFEVRLVSNGDGPLKWVLGGFFFYETQDAFLTNLQSTGYAVLATPDLTDRNVAGFADLTYSITDSIRLTGGIRYTKEKKTQNGYTIATGLTAAQVTTIAGAGGSCISGGTPTAPTLYQGLYYTSNICIVPNGGKYDRGLASWKIGAEADIGPNSMLYGSVRNGFRAGGFTAGTQNVYKPERLTAFEIGSKNRFLDRRLQVNLSAFYWKYKDQQLNQLQPYFLNGIAIGQTSWPFNTNGDLYGAELDVQALVTPRDRITGDLLFAKGKYDKTPTITASNGVNQSLTNANRVNLPKWTLTAGYDHTFPLANDGTVVAGVRTHVESSALMRLNDAASLRPGDYRDPYAKFDLDLTYRAPGDTWSIQAFMKNVTNKAVVGVGSSGQVAAGVWYKVSTNPADFRSASLDPPRTYGLRATAKF